MHILRWLLSLLLLSIASGCLEISEPEITLEQALRQGYPEYQILEGNSFQQITYYLESDGRTYHEECIYDLKYASNKHQAGCNKLPNSASTVKYDDIRSFWTTKDEQLLEVVYDELIVPATIEFNGNNQIVTEEYYLDDTLVYTLRYADEFIFNSKRLAGISIKSWASNQFINQASTDENIDLINLINPTTTFSKAAFEYSLTSKKIDDGYRSSYAKTDHQFYSASETQLNLLDLASLYELLESGLIFELKADYDTGSYLLKLENQSGLKSGSATISHITSPDDIIATATWQLSTLYGKDAIVISQSYLDELEFESIEFPEAILQAKPGTLVAFITNLDFYEPSVEITLNHEASLELIKALFDAYQIIEETKVSTVTEPYNLFTALKEEYGKLLSLSEEGSITVLNSKIFSLSENNQLITSHCESIPTIADSKPVKDICYPELDRVLYFNETKRTWLENSSYDLEPVDFDSSTTTLNISGDRIDQLTKYSLNGQTDPKIHKASFNYGNQRHHLAGVSLRSWLQKHWHLPTSIVNKLDKSVKFNADSYAFEISQASTYNYQFDKIKTDAFFDQQGKILEPQPNKLTSIIDNNLLIKDRCPLSEELGLRTCFIQLNSMAGADSGLGGIYWQDWNSVSFKLGDRLYQQDWFIEESRGMPALFLFTPRTEQQHETMMILQTEEQTLIVKSYAKPLLTPDMLLNVKALEQVKTEIFKALQ